MVASPATYGYIGYLFNSEVRMLARPVEMMSTSSECHDI